MTSAGWGFCCFLGLKIREKAVSVDGGGIGAVSDIGRWTENNDATWIPSM